MENRLGCIQNEVDISGSDLMLCNSDSGYLSQPVKG